MSTSSCSRGCASLPKDLCRAKLTGAQRLFPCLGAVSKSSSMLLLILYHSMLHYVEELAVLHETSLEPRTGLCFAQLANELPKSSQLACFCTTPRWQHQFGPLDRWITDVIPNPRLKENLIQVFVFLFCLSLGLRFFLCPWFDDDLNHCLLC